MSKARLLGYIKTPSNKQDKHDLRYQRNLHRKGNKAAQRRPEPPREKT